MKTHTNNFKNQIKRLGREIDSKIIYTINNQTIELGSDELNSVVLSYEGSLLKSVMKGLEIKTQNEIPVDTVVNAKFGLKVGNNYEYLDFGNYIVYTTEKQEDENQWKMKCYDKMLLSMKKYEGVNVIYPTTVRGYLIGLCDLLNIDFANETDTFANYDKPIDSDLYLGQDLTYRNVLDELAQVTGSIICINDDDELEIRYPNANETPVEPSKNLLNKRLGFQNGYINTSGNFVAQNQTALFNQKVEVEVGETYCYSTNQNIDNMVISYFRSNDTYISRVKVTNKDRIVHQVPNNAAYVRFAINYNNSDTMTQQIINNLQVMVEKNNTRTEPYEDYIEPIVVETFDEEYLKSIDVKFNEKYGPINSVVLSRAAESDNIYLRDEESVTENGLCEVKIKENQIMNFNNRDEFLPDLLDALDGIEFYINDYKSTGITYLELGDYYNVSIGDNIYKCLMLNDDIEIAQGLVETIYTDKLEESETEYTKADTTDNKINQTWIIANKQEGEIEALTTRVEINEDNIQNTYTKEQVNDLIINAEAGLTNKFITNGGNNILRNTGLWFKDTKSIRYLYPNDELYPRDDLYILAEPNYEYWEGVVEKVKETKAANMSGLLLKNGDLKQSQQVRNGKYTLSFKYRKLISLADVTLKINEQEFELTETRDTEVVCTFEVNSLHIDLFISSSADDSCIIYDLMLNPGEEKAEYSQNQNESTTDTVNISKGIEITSTDTNTTFKADSDGIRIYNNNDLENPITDFTDTGINTKKIIVNDEAQILDLYFQVIGRNTWITKL